MDEDIVYTQNQDANTGDPVTAATPTTDERQALDAMMGSMERMADSFRSLAQRLDRLESAEPAGDTGADDLPAGAASPSDTVAERIAKLERRLQEQSADTETMLRGIRNRASLPGAGAVMRTDDPDRTFSLTRAVAGHLTGWANWRSEWPERDIIHDYARKMAGYVARDTQSTFVAPLGGFLVPPEVQTEFIETLDANTVSIKMGARTIPLVGSPATWPRGRGGATAGWTPELASPTKSDVRFGQLMLTPKPLVSVVDISEDLIFQTSGTATRLVQDDMARAMAEALDLGIIKGTHASGEPLGLVNQPGMNTTDYDLIDILGADQNVTDLLDSQTFGPMERNAYYPGAGWIMHPTTVKKLRKAKDADGKLLLFSPMEGQRTSGTGGLLDAGLFWDHPYMSSTLLAAGADADLIFGSFNQILIGNWGALEVAASNQNGTNFELSQVTLKMRQKVDAGLRHVEAFQIAINLDVASL